MTGNNSVHMVREVYKKCVGSVWEAYEVNYCCMGSESEALDLTLTKHEGISVGGNLT